MSSERLQPLYVDALVLPGLPDKWNWAKFEDVAVAVPVGRKYDGKTVVTGGVVPVIDQSISGVMGHHSDEPGVNASGSCPVFTFANHTCAMRWMTHSFSCIQNVFAFRGNDRCDTQYLYYASQGRVVLEEYKGHAPTFRSMFVPVPPLSEQRDIAASLASLDKRIDLLRETNATLEAIAQALFKSWFVDFDPVRAKMAGRAPEGMDEATAALFPDALEETELGLVPKGWHVGALDSIAALNPESWSSKHHPDRLLYVDLANTKENQIEGITEFAFDEAPSRARRVLRAGDVIVGTVRPGNRSFARISVDRTGLTGSTGFAVLRAHHHSDQALVYIAATRDEAIERLAHLADGGAYPAVRPEVVAGAPVVIAPDSVRQAFGEVANHLLAGVGSNQEQSRYLADLRVTLLPRLNSGQLRLPEAQAQLEDALA